MAQSFTTDQGTLIIPGAYSTYKVQTSNSGLSTSGVLMLVGEADAGPDHTQEEDLEANSFGPDQEAEVVAKYRSGPLVDAFRAATAPANDPNLPGAPTRIILVKTNVSAKAQVALTANGAVYAYILDASAGSLGNQIQVKLEGKRGETKPRTGPMVVAAPLGEDTASAKIIVNGENKGTVVLDADSTPATFKAAVDDLAGVEASGGEDRLAHPATGAKISITSITDDSVQIDTDAANQWSTVKKVYAGDTLVIGESSQIAGADKKNVGTYVVTEATALSLKAKKLNNLAEATQTVTQVTVGAAAADNMAVYSPVEVTLEGNDPVNGVGKSLEIAAIGSSMELCLFGTDGAPVGWLSKDGSPQMIVSTSERSATLRASRAADGVEQETSFGGEIALRIGYKGLSASLTVGNGMLQVQAADPNHSFVVELKDFATIGDLAKDIAARPMFKAAAGNGVAAQWPATALDAVATGCASQHGAMTGRIKADAYRMHRKVSEEMSLVVMRNAQNKNAPAATGIPAAQGPKALSGGSKGSTSSANVSAAIDALEKVQGNFLVPLFSRDAAEDIADGLTDSLSSYEVAAVHAAAKSHVLKMSTLKRRRNRQAFLSKKGSFSDAREAAADLAAFRCALTFQDVKALASDGSVKQFQPWMGAVVAAGMQAAGFYKSIVHKTANISGALQAARDFDDRSDTDLEDALLSGLLPLQRAETGGFRWVSDQTTYGKDSNFVFNSIQSVYAADIIAMTTAQRMERAFVGQSVADVSAGVALSFLESVLDDFLRLKLIAQSDDAPKGYKNAKIKISGPSMIVSMEVKLAGSIYFIPISFVVSQVQQTAG